VKGCFSVVTVLIGMAAMMAGCVPAPAISTAVPTAAPTSSPVSIGMLVRDLDVVEHGPSADEMVPVEDSVSLNPGDSLRVTKGGEGVLDFGGFLQLRVFNDTQLNEIVIESAANTPPIARLLLERGGFTGELVKEGSKAIFQTPGGAEITVLGTTFFIVYDPKDGTTTLGNFEGSLGVISNGKLASLNAGHFLKVPAGEPPGPEQPLLIDREAFDTAARELKSPIEVVDTLLVVGPTATSLPATAVISPSPTTAPSDTASPTFTSTASATPVPPTPTNTPLACPPVITVDQPAFCREGPGTNYRVITGFEPQTTLRVDGQSPFKPLWWWVEIPTGGHCWISDAVVTIAGDTSASCVSIIKPPPTYTPTFTPTLTPRPPTKTPTPTIAPDPIPLKPLPTPSPGA
jgi:hypothetical protein